ncbi:MAG TPA: DUF1572 family protein [Longimicrobiales bacterium]|nr:DUF1572 family protein [Longimicrobiales bacterium]
MAIIESVRAEFLYYKALGERAIAQLDGAGLSASPPGGGNSIATICWHVSGNLRSRFTDFLTTDGEKPWRKRDEEFEVRAVTRDELLEKWEQGWSVLLGALDSLTDGDLERTVTIRNQPSAVREALLRSLAHVSYHVGQIVYAAKAARGDEWRYLSIPPGGSEQHNQQLASERQGRR